MTDTSVMAMGAWRHRDPTARSMHCNKFDSAPDCIFDEIQHVVIRLFATIIVTKLSVCDWSHRMRTCIVGTTDEEIYTRCLLGRGLWDASIDMDMDKYLYLWIHRVLQILWRPYHIDRKWTLDFEPGSKPNRPTFRYVFTFTFALHYSCFRLRWVD